MNGVVMSSGEFLYGLRQLFSPPRHPQTKADLYNLMLAYDAAPSWRKYIATRELREDLSMLKRMAEELK